MIKPPFTGEQASDLFKLIHTDIPDRMSIHAKGGFSYFNSFTDDHFEYSYVYLMSYKYGAFEKFKVFGLK